LKVAKNCPKKSHLRHNINMPMIMEGDRLLQTEQLTLDSFSPSSPSRWKKRASNNDAPTYIR